MENGGFGNQIPRRSAAGYAPVRFPTAESFLPSPLDDQFGRTTAPETRTQNPFFIETRQDQPLEDVFSRLNLSSGVGGGSTPGDLVVGGYGFLPPSSQEIQQRNSDFHSGSSLRNGIDTLGELGLGNHEVRANLGSRNNFLGFSNSAPVTQEMSTELGKRSFGVERYGYWNQSQRQYQSPELSSLYSIMHRLNQNLLLRAPMADSHGEVDGFVSGNLSRLRAAASNNRNIRNNFNHQLQRPLSLNNFCLEDWRGSILPLAKDQRGCLLLQEKFQNITIEEIEMVFGEVINHVPELMLDQFGNYIVQKLVQFCNEEQRTRILVSVTKYQYQLIFVCLNIHGTRVMQRILEHLTTPEQVSIAMSALSPVTISLSMDTFGHHVIDNCLKLFSFEDNMYIVKEVAENFFEMATNRSGCCVLQSCVLQSQGELRKQLMADIIANAIPLAEDRYGNYVVQHLMEMRIPEMMINFRKQFEGALISLSCNKYGSNAVQRLMEKSDEELSTQVIIDMLQSPNVSRLLLDPFGNFVFQSALNQSKGYVRNALVGLVRSHVSSMRSNLYGKKILHWFHKRKLEHLYSM